MDEFLQQIFSGLAIGMVYGGLALALCVIFQGAGVLNFAQGELAALATLCAWQLIADGWSFWLALVVVTIGSFVLGMIIERVLIRPVEAEHHLSLLVITLGLFIGINAIMGLVWGFLPKSLDSPFGSGVVEVGDAILTAQQLGMAATIMLVVAVVGAFFRFTQTGLRMRAAAQNPESSRLLGINVGRQLMFGWGLAAAVGAVAGAMSAPVIGTGPDMMLNTILLAFAAAALGGFTSRIGAVIGGLTVGVTTNLASTYVPGIGGDLSLVVPFAVITVVLLFRPTGIFGRASIARA
jgi:branched-chain amino acid transport system permease protein